MRERKVFIEKWGFAVPFLAKNHFRTKCACPSFLIVSHRVCTEAASPRMENLTFRHSPFSSSLHHHCLRLLLLWEQGEALAYVISKCDLSGTLDLLTWVEAFGGSELRWGAAWGCPGTLFGCIGPQAGGEDRLAGTCPAASRARMRRFLSRKGRFSLRQSKSGTRSASKDFCKSISQNDNYFYAIPEVFHLVEVR